MTRQERAVSRKILNIDERWNCFGGVLGLFFEQYAVKV